MWMPTCQVEGGKEGRKEEILRDKPKSVSVTRYIKSISMHAHCPALWKVVPVGGRRRYAS